MKNNFDFEIKNLNVKYEKDFFDYPKLNLDSLIEIKPSIEKIYKDDYINFNYQLSTIKV
jgi:hypothetical protein